MIKLFSVVVLCCIVISAASAVDVGTGFSYQGKLTDAMGAPVNGAADFRFTLWDAASGGAQVGSLIQLNAVTVNGGLFTVQLDFGASAFTGSARWIEIEVRSPAGVGSYSMLGPRARIVAVPYALYALNAGSSNADMVDGYHAVGAPTANSLLPLNASGKFPNSALLTGAGNGLDADLLDGQHGAFYQSASNLNAGTLADARLSPNVALLNKAQTFTQSNTFSADVRSPIFYDLDNAAYFLNPAGLSKVIDLTVNGTLSASLSADSLTGTVPDARLSSNVALLTGAQTFSGAKTFSNASNSFTGSGAGLAELNASNLSTGTVPDARLSSNVALLSAAQTFAADTYFSGKVGIGTTAPANKLHVEDSSTVSVIYAKNTKTGIGYASAIRGEYVGSPGCGTGVKGYGGEIGVAGIADVGTSLFTVRGIYGEARSSYQAYGVYGSASGSATNIGVYGDALGGSQNYAIYGYAPQASNSYAGYFIGRVHATGRLTALSDVGVGTADPTQRLQVDSGDILVRGSGNFGSAGQEARLYLGDTNNYIKAVHTGGLRIGTYSGTDSLCLMGSNVGVGTTSPEEKLTVRGSLKVDQGDTNDGTFASGGVIKFGAGLTGEGIGSKRTTGGNWAGIDFYTGSNIRMTVANGGNVGIGTTSPAYKLDVNGTIRGSNVSPSDLRLKTNIRDLANSLDSVMKLRGVSFDWKDESLASGRQIGVIAQEVEAVFPELVSIDGDGYRSVAYDKLVPVLIEAVKEQQAEIKSQQERIDARDARINDLEQRLQRLERLLESR